jgi:hypothetical protein
MNSLDYAMFLQGREAAARGAGLSDSPHGGSDGDLWRAGVRSWLDEHGDETDQDGSGRLSDQAPALQDAPGPAISTPPISGHHPETGQG